MKMALKNKKSGPLATFYACDSRQLLAVT